MVDNALIANKFCDICNSLLQTWQLRKHLFDTNDEIEALKDAMFGNLFNVIIESLQELWILKLAKLHDKVNFKDKYNLTLQYIIITLPFSNDKLLELKNLKENMDIFYKCIKQSRNQIISHNDLASIKFEKLLGTFSKNDDEQYFACLIEFADIVSREFTGEPFCYDDLIKNDVLHFMHCIKKCN